MMIMRNAGVKSKLIKNFDRIRDYMRQLYIYGFKRRTEYDKKSARSYDNERRRIESWLGDFMRFRQTPDGKMYSFPWTAVLFPEIRSIMRLMQKSLPPVM